MNNISKIRIEEIKDHDNNEFYYYIFSVKDTGEIVKIGKLKTKPQCYKQLVIYHQDLSWHYQNNTY